MGKEISYGLVIEMNEPSVNNEALTVPDPCCLEGHVKVSSYRLYLCFQCVYGNWIQDFVY